jgi:hypothetical protein
MAEARWMDDGRHLLYCRNQLVGVVINIGWTDFPEVGGKIAVSQLSNEVRTALEYIDQESKTEEGVHNWPFPDGLAEHWRIVKPDGTEVEIMAPVVDFADGFVTWR